MDKKQAQRVKKILPVCKALLTVKYGARNSRPDFKMLQQVHDLTVRLGAVCQKEHKSNV